MVTASVMKDLKVEVTPTSRCINSAQLQNSSKSLEERVVDSDLFTSQDKDLISFLRGIKE